MKSGKQRKVEIKRKRALKKTESIKIIRKSFNAPIAADHSKLKSPSAMPIFLWGLEHDFQ
ncbi:hypothetical protein [Marinibactrum halimedae]|uniref:hypothetical protein n=1 Tax=Marinibactrum halimedae TaxID=1444977 RepID=UPI001E53A9BD|nr:hypothetical protein [Marinibactrum halimedae]MCD9458865.1 hypothetical protein [Marinibactrum halimedae]